MASRIGVMLLTICVSVCVALGFALSMWPASSTDPGDTASHLYGLLILLVGVALCALSKQLARSWGIAYAITWWFLELPLMIGSVFGVSFLLVEIFFHSRNTLTGVPNPSLHNKGIWPVLAAATGIAGLIWLDRIDRLLSRTQTNS